MRGWDCILSLDLGTSSVKAGVVSDDGLVAPPTHVPCRLTYGRRVTLQPEALIRAVHLALRNAAEAARSRGLEPNALAVVSQAQSYIRIGPSGEPVGPVVSWLSRGDPRRVKLLTQRFPDFAERTGFSTPSDLQFVAKLCEPRPPRAKRTSHARALLLNEYVIMRLTGQAYGDTTLHGMGGLYDIRRRCWWPEIIEAIGASPDNLAPIGPAGAIGAPLSDRAAASIGMGKVPVLSCGLDQSASAIGAGVGTRANMMCNFGTAMVVYAQSDEPLTPAGQDEIVGIDPLTDRYFVLGLENECGNILSGLARMFFRGRMGDLIAAGVSPPRVSDRGPKLVPGRGGTFSLARLTPTTDRAAIARAALDHFAHVCSRLIKAIAARAGLEPRVVVGGGLSRSKDWLDYVARTSGLDFETPRTEHPSLIGAAIIARAALSRYHKRMEDADP